MTKAERIYNIMREGMGGHQHFDSKGTSGTNCPICIRQHEACEEARQLLSQEDTDEMSR